MPRTETADGKQLANAMAKIAAEVHEGLEHGHFEMTITCTVGNKGVRELVVKAGKSHLYRITVDELAQLI